MTETSWRAINFFFSDSHLAWGFGPHSKNLVALAPVLGAISRPRNKRASRVY